MPAQNAWQIRIELKRIRPPIWRRVLVWEKTTLTRLHALPRVVRSMMQTLSAGRPEEFEPFVDRLIETAKWRWEQPEPYDILAAIGSAIQHVVIDPLAEFGMISTRYAGETLRSFSLTDFGRALLPALYLTFSF